MFMFNYLYPKEHFNIKIYHFYVSEREITRIHKPYCLSYIPGYMFHVTSRQFLTSSVERLK